jgi:hypothetical protein
VALWRSVSDELLKTGGGSGGSTGGGGGISGGISGWGLHSFTLELNLSNSRTPS